MRRLLKVCALAGAAALPMVSLAGAQTKVAPIFQIGRFDGSSNELAGGTPKAPVLVHANGDQVSGQWYAFQPERAVTAASQSASTVAFNLPGRPAPVYTVTVALLFETASVPALHVIVNGHSGNFYPRPKLDPRVGDSGGLFFPAYSQATLTFTVSGAFLRTGENRISFAAVAPADERDVPNAGFHYDALSMSAGAEGVAQSTAQVVPSVFFVRRPEGLEEASDVYLRAGATPIKSASVVVAGRRIALPLPGELSWGEAKYRIYLPSFSPGTLATTTLEQPDGHAVVLTDKLQPSRHWTVYVVPHVHLDIGYTDYQAKVSAIQSRILDEALDLAAIHPDFRFSLDGMWSFQQFLQNRTPADQARAYAALQSKKLFVPAQYSNELTGFASAEALIRSLYPSAQMDAQHGLPFDYANITDVPSFSWSYASILASAGIHQLLAGSNNDRAPVLPHGHLDAASPFWWEGPDGQKVLMWYSHHYHQMWTLFGLPPLVDAGAQTLPLFLQTYERPGYKANAVLLYGSQAENTDLYPEQASLATAWNRSFAFPHLQYSGFHAALTAIADQFHGDLPTVRGDGGPYWEDGIAADAAFASMERENEVRAPSAEKISTVDSLFNPRIAADMAAFHSLWKNIILMDEHTWLSAASYSDPANEEATVQLAVKDGRARRASQLTDTLMRHGMADLADLVDISAPSLVVFNPLNWQRSSMVSVDLAKGMGLVDNTTGTPVAFDAVSARGENTSRVTFLAKDVPAVGYKTYSIRASSAAADNDVPISGETVENAYYRIRVDGATGALLSIYDKQLHREIVDPTSPYRFGQYLYVTTADGRVVVHKAANGSIASIRRTPRGLEVKLTCSDTNTPHIFATIFLPDATKQILFTEDIEKVSTGKPEAVYFAFPFAMTHPSFRYEIQNGQVNPQHDMYPGAGLDWFSVQHWAAVDQNGWSAAIFPQDASLMTFGDITRLKFPRTFGARKGTLFSYAMNNYWHTNYRAEQGGHFRFRYLLTSAEQLPESTLSHMGWDFVTPFETDEVTPLDKAIPLHRPLAMQSHSFLKLDDSALLLQTWKTAEDGRGYILRFVDLGGPARTVPLRIPGVSVERVWRDDSVERDLHPIALTSNDGWNLAIKPHAILTVRVIVRKSAPPACGRFCGKLP